MVKTGNTRDLDMGEILHSVKAQYEEVAARSREEAEQWNKRKVSGFLVIMRNRVDAYNIF